MTMSDSQPFPYEPICLDSESREVLDLLFCFKEPRMIIWDICHTARDLADLFNIISVMVTLDIGESGEMDKELNIQPGSVIPEKTMHDVIHRLKENGIWDQLKRTFK